MSKTIYTLTTLLVLLTQSLYAMAGTLNFLFIAVDDLRPERSATTRGIVASPSGPGPDARPELPGAWDIFKATWKPGTTQTQKNARPTVVAAIFISIYPA
ncbi:MAG: hypothetical protein OQJ84_03945 [Xanthomonadales bacterium]|nr:hypothetical protein [Xanthomonadales bacterium]